MMRLCWCDEPCDGPGPCATREHWLEVDRSDLDDVLAELGIDVDAE